MRKEREIQKGYDYAERLVKEAARNLEDIARNLEDIAEAVSYLEAHSAGSTDAFDLGIMKYLLSGRAWT